MDKWICFQSLQDARKFFEIVDSVPEAVYLCADGGEKEIRSMMDMFCFDLKKPLRMHIASDEEDAGQIMEMLRDYIVEEGN